MAFDKEISATIINMARARGTDKTICPSEVAKSLFKSDWQKHMDDVRTAAIKLHHEGKVLITQRGKAIDTDHIKGPVRIRIII